MRELSLILALAARAPATETHVLARLETERPLAAQRWLDVDGDGKSELVVLERGGVVRAFRTSAKTLVSSRELALPDPAHSLVALEGLTTSHKARGLFVLSPRGAELYQLGEDGWFAPEPTLLSARAKSRLRTRMPLFAPLAKDVNADGAVDLIVPSGDTVDVFVQAPGEKPTFTKMASAKVAVSLSSASDAGELSDELAASIRIPALHMADVNGDGRADLIVEAGEKRAFHLVRADGTIPHDPDVTVDLSIFRDTTPEATIAPGRTFGGLDRTVFESRDLDLDGIPDYVIAHRRKVWVFHGTSAGPQFKEPTTILKAAEDATAVLIANLDDDKLPDLLLFKVEVPGVATLLRGFVAEWEIEVSAVGYPSRGGKAFEPEPRWRSDLSFRVPPIASILRDPERILNRFEDVGRKFREPIEADLDADGTLDLALESEDGKQLWIWLGDKASASPDASSDEAVLKRVLFGEEDKTWDIERVLGFLSGLGQERIRARTRNREPSARFELRTAAEWRLASLAQVDVDGDGRAEIALGYERVDTSGAWAFDVLGVK